MIGIAVRSVCATGIVLASELPMSPVTSPLIQWRYCWKYDWSRPELVLDLAALLRGRASPPPA